MNSLLHYLCEVRTSKCKYATNAKELCGIVYLKLQHSFSGTRRVKNKMSRLFSSRDPVLFSFFLSFFNDLKFFVVLTLHKILPLPASLNVCLICNSDESTLR
jgi:hypothetical protein